MGRRNIVFIIESPFPYYSGGIENWLYNVLERFPDSYSVWVISEANDGIIDPFYEVPKTIQVVHYATLRFNRLLRYLFQNTILRGIEIIISSIRVKNRLKHIVVNPEQTTIVALGTIMATSAALQYKKIHPGTNVICSARGLHAETESAQIPKLKSFFYKKEHFNVKHSDILAVNGQDTYEYYKQKYGVEGRVLLNGVNVELFDNAYPSPFNYEGPCVVSVGTVIDIKGVNELIKAFALVVNKSGNDRIRLFFVGKGNVTKYKELARSLGLIGKICFMGPSKFVIPYYKNATVVACLSGGGGFSMAALEAMASRTPIVAWDSPVYRQFNNKLKTMQLIEQGNISQLASAIEDIVNNREKYEEMGDNARLIAGSFDWSHVMNNLLKICE